MVNRTQTQVAISIAVLVWAAMLTVQGVNLDASYLRPYSLVVGVVGVLLIAYERWFWRWPGIRRVVRRPNMQGTWRGTLQSTWIDPSTGMVVKPVTVFLAVTQTYSTVTPRMLTPESSSESVASSLELPKNGTPAVVWTTYVNTPGLLIQGRSRPHHGAMKLEVHGAPRTLKGTYWTDRKTSGEIVFDRHTRHVHTDFTSAAMDAALS